MQTSARHAIDLVPRLRTLRLLRTWTGLCDVTPDYSPIMGKTEVDGFFVDGGWGTYGFKAAPISGVCMAELVATGKTPKLIEPFALSRFWNRRLVSELAAAAVSH
jgi:sarcosine oxidase subunit beta